MWSFGRSGMKGVNARGNSIQIDFVCDGKRFRETLKIPPTQQNLEFAKYKREIILHDILFGYFDYIEHFPNSLKARKIIAKINLTDSEA